VNWKTPITMLVLLGVLLGAAYYGWQTVIDPATGDDETATAPSETRSTCQKVREFRKGETVRPRDVTVNVYNAGIISGLAGETLNALADKGFTAGAAANAPDDIPTTNVTILIDERRSPLIRLVARQFTGPVRFSRGPELRPGVDVLIGNEFQAVDEAAKRFLRVKRVVMTCKPASPSAG